MEKIISASAVLERELWHTMTREQKKQYEACCEKCMEAHDLELLDSFAKGFCLGMRLTLEGVFSFRK